MTQTSAFHFESLVWDWPIAIYLFLIGISAGLVTLAVLLRRFYPQAGGGGSTLLRPLHADCRAWRGDPRSVDPRLPPDKTVDLLEADVPLQFYLGDVDGGDAVSALHGGAGAVAGENL